jgi:membrane-anchored glycerophosphoryl diester phosphodiesterase (GDPDase)
MSLACAQKAKLSLVITEKLYIISTPEGRVVTNRIAQCVPLKLTGHIFPTHLIILDSQGIDVILGMKWMKTQKDLLNMLAHLVRLNYLVYGKVMLHLPAVARLKASLHHAIRKSLEEISMV